MANLLFTLGFIRGSQPETNDPDLLSKPPSRGLKVASSFLTLENFQLAIGEAPEGRDARLHSRHSKARAMTDPNYISRQ